MNSRWNIILWNKAANVVCGDFNQIKVDERNMVYYKFEFYK
ncbi:hypothetical protein [Clostridium sp.]|nr:hypothetical protein [Clostridium sp.]MDR3595627.1 hypothetical protein [Clostridium sp.]